MLVFIYAPDSLNGLKISTTIYKHDLLGFLDWLDTMVVEGLLLDFNFHVIDFLWVFFPFT